MIPARLRNWHEDDWIVSRLTQPAGQVLLLLSTALLLPDRVRMAIIVAVALSMIVPARRIEILAAGGLWILYQRLPAQVHGAGAVAVMLGMGTVLVLLAVCFAAARRFAGLPPIVRRFPIATLHLFLLGALAFCVWSTSRGHGGLVLGAGIATLAALIPFLLWRVSYLVLSGRRGTAAKSRFIDHVAYCLPLWGGTDTPYGKGLDYLRHHMAVEPIAMARSRAAGLKLLVLARVWIWVGRGFDQVMSETGLHLPAWTGGWTIAIPDLGSAVAAGPEQFGIGIRWMAIWLGLFDSVIRLAVRGHVIIGVLRLFGFNVFRNTYRPLFSTTIVEFWNRYYYYFKELMVEFFFFPTFVGLSRRRVEIRLVLAVLAAAALGNFYYHVVLDYHRFFGSGVERALQGLGGRFIYSAVLGAGVAVSMLRERKNRRTSHVSGARWSRTLSLRAMLGVWLFYALLHIWNVGRHTLDIGQRTTFMLGLFGL